ncbi:ABC transporter substrate-binding protein [Tuberibacillus sp. Marseille-P3662]|uniref:ABC transporter substrate-binding protein n=1 Tax=Tuberibacillus sp. Marseille-P3662 TaxID=1965358 RepID=UPI000A1CE7E9|nr:iron-siderophore ABC transporter substrate-binding protein [Tuberibacillus sp. Marseille-P3662]
MKRFLQMFSVFILALTVLAGCGSGESDQSDSNSNSSSDKTSKENTIKVDHAMGTSEVPADPKRVVVLTNEGTEALLAMGVKPVGAVKSWLGDPWYDHIKKQMDGVKVVGTESEVSLDTIAKLNPDLIIGNKMRQEKIYDKLSAIAPTVFSETLRGNWKINFKQYAKALNKQEKGQQVLEKFDNRIQSIHDRLGDKVNQEISLVRFVAGDIRIYHKNSFAGVILDQIGFKRPENQRKDDLAQRHVTKELIPKMNGDKLFYFTYETGDGKANQVEDEWTNSKLWKNLEVVQEGDAHKVSDATWNTAGGVLAANEMLDDIEHFFNIEQK